MDSKDCGDSRDWGDKRGGGGDSRDWGDSSLEPERLSHAQLRCSSISHHLSRMKKRKQHGIGQSQLSMQSAPRGVQPVVRVGKRKWQVTHAGKYIGIFDDLPSAVHAKQQQQQQQKQQQCPDKEYKGVVKKGNYFQAQAYDKSTGNMKYVGTASSAEAAFRILVQGGHCEDLVKNKKRRLGAEAVERFKICMDIYTNNDGSPAVMSDLTSAHQARVAWPLMGTCTPALYFFSLMGKDGPWRDSLGARWVGAFKADAGKSICSNASLQSLRSMKSMRSAITLRSMQLLEPEDLTEDDLNAIITILQLAALDTWPIDRAAWDLNVNRNKLYFMGWQRLIKRFYPMFVDQPEKLTALPKSKLHATKEKLRKAHAAGTDTQNIVVCF